jgi:transposase
MEVVHERCAGLDVHKRTGVACVLGPGPGGSVEAEVRTFSTLQGQLEALASWLAEVGVTHVALEATGVYWQPVVRHEALLNREGEKGPLQRTVAAGR